jgi:hypothetical protein
LQSGSSSLPRHALSLSGRGGAERAVFCRSI